LRIGGTIWTDVAGEDSDNGRNNRDRPSMLSKFDALPAVDATVCHPPGVNRVPAGVISRHPARRRTIGLRGTAGVAKSRGDFVARAAGLALRFTGSVANRFRLPARDALVTPRQIAAQTIGSKP